MAGRLQQVKRRFARMVAGNERSPLNALAKVVEAERKRRGLDIGDMPLPSLQQKVATTYLQGPEDAWS